MPERFELGDLVRICHASSPKRYRLWRVVGFRRLCDLTMVSIVAERGFGHDELASYALEHAEDVVTRLGRLANARTRPP